MEDLKSKIPNQEMIEKSKPFNDLEVIRNTVENALNNDGKDCLFQIEIEDNNNKYDINNLTSKDSVQGVMFTTNFSITEANNGTEIKDVSIKFLVPLNEDNDNYNDRIKRAIKLLNNTSVVLQDSVQGDEESGQSEIPDLMLFFQDMLIINNMKLPKPVAGVEYEEITLSFKCLTSYFYMTGDRDTIMINEMLLNGKISINESSVKTCDGEVFGINSPIQKNTVNGVQHSIEVAYLMYPKDKLHKQLSKEKNEDIDYKVTYYDGYEINTYNMFISNYQVISLNGDAKKATITFIRR